MCKKDLKIYSSGFSHLQIDVFVNLYHADGNDVKSQYAEATRILDKPKLAAFLSSAVNTLKGRMVAIDKKVTVLNDTEWRHEMGKKPGTRVNRSQPSVSVGNPDHEGGRERLWMFKYDPNSPYRTLIERDWVQVTKNTEHLSETKNYYAKHAEAVCNFDLTQQRKAMNLADGVQNTVNLVSEDDMRETHWQPRIWNASGNASTVGETPADPTAPPERMLAIADAAERAVETEPETENEEHAEEAAALRRMMLHSLPPPAPPVGSVPTRGI